MLKPDVKEVSFKNVERKTASLSGLFNILSNLTAG